MLGSACGRLKWLAELVLVETKHSGKEECEKGRLWWLERAEQVLGPLPVEFVDGGERSILLSAPTPRESSTRARVRKEKIFACYDADNDGMLSFGELMHLAADVHAEFYPTATPLDEDALELEVMEILRQIEVHQDHCVGRWNGTVEFEEFLPWLAEQETKYLQTQPRPAVPSRASCLRFDALRSRMNLSRWRRIAKPLLPRLKSDAHAAAAGRLPRSRSHDDLLATSHEVQETSNGPNVLVRSRSEDDLLARESGRRETGKDEESEDVLKKFCHRLSSVSPRAGRNGEVARPGPGSRLWGGEHGRSEARNRLSACTRALTDQQPSSRRAVLPHTQGQDSEDPPSSRKSDEEVSRQPPSPREQATASAPRSALDALRDLVIAGGRASLVLAVGLCLMLALMTGPLLFYSYVATMRQPRPHQAQLPPPPPPPPAPLAYHADSWRPLHSAAPHTWTGSSDSLPTHASSEGVPFHGPAACAELITTVSTVSRGPLPPSCREQAAACNANQSRGASTANVARIKGSDNVMEDLPACGKWYCLPGSTSPRRRHDSASVWQSSAGTVQDTSGKI